MEFSRLLVHLELAASNEALLKFTLSFADTFDLNVMGITASQMAALAYSEGYSGGELLQEERTELESETETVRLQFESAMLHKISCPEWRPYVGLGPVAEFIANEARSADLIMTALGAAGSVFDETRVLDIGDLVLRAGRPVLIVPPECSRLTLESVIVAWKDTRESRRAITDALPLLKKSGHVTVMEVADADDVPAAQLRVADVVAWLRRHYITAEALVVGAKGNTSQQIEEIATDRKAECIVAGAYGHNALRERIFGGVTRDLLRRQTRLTFLSH